MVSTGTVNVNCISFTFMFYIAIYWFGYEYMKSLQMKVTSRTEPTFTQTFVAGASAGTVSIEHNLWVLD